MASIFFENKKKPENLCYGNCYLIKELKETSGKEQKQQDDDQKKSFNEDYLVKQIRYLKALGYMTNREVYRDIVFKLSEHSSDISHPPPAIHFILKFRSVLSQLVS